MINCARAEKLLALYAGSDLAPNEEHAVSTHLQACESCSRAARELASARELMRAYAPPEFDAAFFDGMRQSVMREIKREPPPSGFASLIPRIFSRRALAYAASFAIIFAVGLSVYKFRSGREGAPDSTKQVAESNNGQDEIKRGVDLPAETENAMVTASPPKPIETIAGQPRRRNASTVSTSRQTIRGNRQQPHVGPSKIESVAPVEIAVNSSASEVERKMLRIELQTSDPNVRIIWLSPQPTENHPKK